MTNGFIKVGTHEMSDFPWCCLLNSVVFAASYSWLYFEFGCCTETSSDINFYCPVNGYIRIIANR